MTERMYLYTKEHSDKVRQSIRFAVDDVIAQKVEGMSEKGGFVPQAFGHGFSWDANAPECFCGRQRSAVTNPYESTGFSSLTEPVSGTPVKQLDEAPALSASFGADPYPPA